MKVIIFICLLLFGFSYGEPEEDYSGSGKKHRYLCRHGYIKAVDLFDLNEMVIGAKRPKCKDNLLNRLIGCPLHAGGVLTLKPSDNEEYPFCLKKNRCFDNEDQTFKMMCEKGQYSTCSVVCNEVSFFVFHYKFTGFLLGVLSILGLIFFCKVRSKKNAKAGEKQDHGATKSD